MKKIISTENLAKIISKFISECLYLNINRCKMRYDIDKVSTDGFLLNLNCLCMNLCNPIINKKNNKFKIIRTRT